SCGHVLTAAPGVGAARGASVWRGQPGRGGLHALRDAGHVRQPVGDALVAVDAGRLPGRQVAAVDEGRAAGLAGQVHGVVVVAVAALQRVVGLEPVPLVLGELDQGDEVLVVGVD